jgi:hypothetical protein
LFLPKQHRDLGNDLVTIFNISHPALLYVVHRNINQIRRLRNVIAHNGQTIFKQDDNVIDFNKVEIILARIKELTMWLGISIDVYKNHFDLLTKQKEIILSIVKKSS